MYHMYANLHFHSIHSDGTYTPEELVQIAAKEGYKALALTDHDTATGWTEFQEACRKSNMDFIPAVEFDCLGFGTDFHIVGFDFDANNKDMQEHLKYMCDKMTYRTRKLFERALEKKHLHGITWEEVVAYNKGIKFLCNDHVFRAMKNKGIITDKEYPDFFKNNFIYTIPCETPYKTFSVQEVITLINNSGGVAVLAHPHEKLKFVDPLMKMGLKGIEVWHPDLSDEEISEAEKIAAEKKLYISGGTDHSGVMDGHNLNLPIPPLKYGTTQKNYLNLKRRIYG